MNKEIFIQRVEVNNKWISVILNDNNIIFVSKNYTSRLKKSSLKDLKDYKIMPSKKWIHWEKIDEDVSIEPLLVK